MPVSSLQMVAKWLRGLQMSGSCALTLAAPGAAAAAEVAGAAGLIRQSTGLGTLRPHGMHCYTAACQTYVY
jgi:hypothetical protein